MRDFISLKDFTPAQWKQLLSLSREVKGRASNFRQMIPGKSIVLIFEKPSLRTRLTFELGVRQLGGDAVYLDYQEARLGGRESLGDVARNLERWFDCIVARTFSHEVVVELAEHAKISVINALSDEEHPCQAVADLFTLSEKWEHLGDASRLEMGAAGILVVTLLFVGVWPMPFMDVINSGVTDLLVRFPA